jgi:hypothetical protein
MDDKLKNMNELEKEYKEHIGTLEKQCYVDNDDIVINVADEYRVPLSSCPTQEAILGWVRQLTEKTWITVPLIRRFVDTAAEHHKIKIQTPVI